MNSFNKDKDSSNDDPSSIALKPFVKKYNGITKHIHVIPPGSSSKDAIRTWLTDDKTKNCFLQNLYTKRGRDVTAKYYDYAKQWKIVEEKLSDDTSIQKKVFLFIQCHQQHNKRRMCAGFREGQHRFCALVHASTASTIDVDNGYVKPDTLTVDDFKNVDIQSKDNPPTDSDFKRLMKTVLPSEGCKNIMLNEHMPVEVTFITDPDVDVPALHRALLASSMAVSDAKIDSARPSATYQIGDLAEEFIEGLTIEALSTTIDSSNISFKPHNRIKSGEAAKLSETHDGNINAAFPAPRLINHVDFLEYCRDPFTDDNKRKMKKLLETPMFDGVTGNPIGPAGKTTMKTVPFAITYDKIVHETGQMKDKAHLATGQMRNEFYLAPPILSLIFAQQKNTHPRDILKCAERLDALLYFIRFHLGAQSGYDSQSQLHGALEAFFQSTEGQLINSKKNKYSDVFDGVLAATDICIKMINAANSKCCSNENNDTDADMLKKVGYQVQCSGNAFKHLDDSVGNGAARSTIQNLCKCCPMSYFFPFQKKILTSPRNTQRPYILVHSGLGNSIARSRFSTHYQC